MKVIGAGFGRTGTMSLKEALERLGYDPCYHMSTVAEEPKRANAWLALYHGAVPDWDQMFAGFDAGVDLPVCLYVKELIEKYPKAKVILTERDCESWYESMETTVYQIGLLPTWMHKIPVFGIFLKLVRETIWDGYFAGRFDDKRFAIEAFETHNATIRHIVPADKLLIFDVKEGWGPLCEFLGQAVPDEPFPHANERAEMQKNVRFLRGIQWGIPSVVVIVMVLIVWWMF